MENTLPPVPNPSKINTLIIKLRAKIGLLIVKLRVIPREFWIPAAIGVAALLIGLIIYFVFPNLRKNLGPQNIWTPSETPPPFLGGNQSYEINGGDKKYPTITNLTLSPQDAKMGQKQTASVTVTNTTPVKEVIVILHLDNNKDFEYRLKLSEGTTTDGVWSQSYTFPWTYNNNYRVTVKARNEQGLGNMTTISIR